MRCPSRPTATPRWISPRGAPARCDSLHRSRGSVNYRHMTKPATLGELRQTEWASRARIHRTVKDELRQNLICLLENGSALFPGIVGYADTVIPQLVNALLSRHNFILLGLRGQAKSRILRQLVTLHFGLLPRANRGIFAINELPDLSGKIQVGLFNIMQEGDVQIKGYPVRL